MEGNGGLSLALFAFCSDAVLNMSGGNGADSMAVVDAENWRIRVRSVRASGMRGGNTAGSQPARLLNVAKYMKCCSA